VAVPKVPSKSSPPPNPERFFSTAQVARLFNTTAAEVRQIVHAAGLRVRRRHRRLFLTFPDLVVVRTALQLRRQDVPLRRLGQALRKLRRELPADAGVSAVRLWAKGEELLVQRGQLVWDVDSGQFVFPFALGGKADGEQKRIHQLSRQGVPGTQPSDGEPTSAAERWYSLAVAREEAGDLAGARQAYLHALRYDPHHSDACVNLGRLAHQAGRLKQAVNWYRKALASSPNDPIAHYDLAIALEDLGDFAEAVREYQRALQANWDFPEAHFNLSRLYRAMGRILEATRHLRIYRRLTEKPS
jgi:tetratricopeptide (TPR) repeat protein